tara:strand:+ start:468 stop:1037 length:570 start_codon:yes stop_codon:yes gene_type:complete
METINTLLTRVSVSNLTDPYPLKKDMDLVYQAALRAPDHGRLRPWRFIQVTDSGRERLGNIFVKSAKKNNIIEESKLSKFKLLPLRAPMVIILITNVMDVPKIPPTEQIQSTAAATQNMMLALHDMGFGSIWKTGAFTSINNKFIAEDLSLSKNSEVVGYLYVGTPKGNIKDIPELKNSDYVTYWREKN